MKNRIKRDVGLSVRMLITMGLLAAVYLGFLTILAKYGVGSIGLIFFAGIMLTLQWFFSDKMAMIGMKAKEVTEAEEPELHAMVARLAAMADIPKPRVAVSTLPIPNAFATGRSPKKAIVAVTKRLQEMLTPQELEAVVGHELAHVIHRDVAVMTFASFFATVAFFIMRAMFWFGGGSRRDSSGGSMMIVYVSSMVVWGVSQLLLLALGRYRELAADRGGCQLTGSPSQLASALVKISGAVEKIPKQDLRNADAMSAFFIVPVKLRNIFSTHPTLEKRLHQLSKMQRELEGR